ncbi:MAG: hypothetical protein H6730_10380 [Deltaproteobacteria bacterium]|nr:hypothetical protein [Deltaproteobacteria bacterium]
MKLIRSLAGLALALALGACAFILPASWRDFRVDPDDVPPAVTRAVDARQLDVADWDQAANQITTGWSLYSLGTEQSRERYIIRWERNEGDNTLTVYVRHEAQDRVVGVELEWSATYHEAKKELALLDAITAELKASTTPP